jgi:dipeptidase E
MKKILLTSTGFDNINIKNKFLDFLDKSPEEAKILFIITAANDPDAVRILSGCLDDLTGCNIKDENITIYDMHKLISKEEILQYDAIYVCGGSTEYLVERIEEIKFKEVLDYYIENGGIYIGVSAGSVAASGKYINGLNLISNDLDVHCSTGSNNGIIENENEIFLTDNQAICILDDKKYIFE